MGFYTHIPEDQLGKRISMDDALDMDANVKSIIVLVVNPTFVAKAWAFSNLELRRFTMVDEHRIRRFYLMPSREEAMIACLMDEDPLDDPAYHHHLRPLGHV